MTVGKDHVAEVSAAVCACPKRRRLHLKTLYAGRRGVLSDTSLPMKGRYAQLNGNQTINHGEATCFAHHRLNGYQILILESKFTSFLTNQVTV